MPGSKSNSDPAIFPNDDAVINAAQSTSRDAAFDVSHYPEEKVESYLFIEAIALDFSPDYSHPCLKQKRQGQLEIFLFLMRGVVCELRLMSTDSEIDGSERNDGRPMYLLLARDRDKGLISQSVHHYLLLVYVKDGLAVRGTVMILLIPEDHLQLLEDLKPQKRHVVLT